MCMASERGVYECEQNKICILSETGFGPVGADFKLAVFRAFFLSLFFRATDAGVCFKGVHLGQYSLGSREGVL